MLKAIIFDLDGTILENNKAYDYAFAKVLNDLGIDTSNGFTHIGGVGIKSNWKRFIEIYHLDKNLSLDELEKQTQEAYLHNMEQIKIREGFEDLTRKIKKTELKIALATGNDKETTDKLISHFGMENYFDAISTIYEAGAPKPEPEIFLLAAKRLDVLSDECLVIEDSEAGLESAKEANMAYISIHDYPFTKLSVEKLQSLYINQ